jgi:predicted DNA-binding protein
MSFTVEMDDNQYERLKTILEAQGTTIEDSIADFFDDIDDSFVGAQRLESVINGSEKVIPWKTVMAANGV